MAIIQFENRELVRKLDDEYEDYLSDESKMKGFASTISFPKSKEEVADIVNQLSLSSVSITVQGGRTGICGAAVPLGGHVMNLSRMTRAESLRKTEGGYLLKVQSGVALCDLRHMLMTKEFNTAGWDDDSLQALEDLKKDPAYFWPPDPTETSAVIGGMMGTNAQSITDFRYGRLKEYIEEIELVDAQGRIFTTKNVERYLGSEGMYGIFTAASLRLIRQPKELWGICFFFEEECSSLYFAEEVLEIRGTGPSSVAAVEYLSSQALTYSRRLRVVSSKLQELPDIDERYKGVIYVELHGNGEREMEKLLDKLAELFLRYETDENSTWALSGESGIEKLKLLRHSVPESVNMEIRKRAQSDARITKLSTDLTTCNRLSEDVLYYQKTALEQGLETVVFGHVPENRIHVNIISHSYEDYRKGKMLLETWYRRALESGGSVFREHGVGKVKRDFFRNIMGAEILAQIAADKKELDPQNLLNPGNKL